MLKLSICYVIESNFPSGTDPTILEYVTNLSKIGVDVHVLCYGEEEYRTDDIDGVHVHRLSNTRSHIFSELEFMVKASKILESIVEKERIEIMQVYAGLHTLLGLSLKLRKKIKIVYFILTVNLRRPRPLEMVIQQSFSKISDSVIVLDSLMRDYIFGRGVQRNVFVVPEGVNLKRFEPKKEPALRRHLNVHGNEYLLGYVGAIHPYRKLYNVILAFKRSLSQIPNIKLMLVGDGSDLKKLRTLARSLGIEKRVIFTGRVSYKEVHRYINACDIGISYVPITKTYDVQPPLKIYEYLACGLPTISTKTSASKKLIKHGDNGVLCGDSPSELSNAIIQLLSDRELMAKMRNNARRSVLNSDWEKITKGELLEVYKHVSAE